MKKLILVSALLLACFSAFPEGLEVQNYFDFASWTYDEQVFYLSGFMLGTWAAAYLASLDGYSNAHLLAASSKESIDDILAQVLSWYNRTKKYDTPLYIALYRRKLDY